MVHLGSIFRDLVAVHPCRRLVPAFGETKAAQPPPDIADLKVRLKEPFPETSP